MKGMMGWQAANDHPKAGVPAWDRAWVRPRGETWYRPAPPAPNDGAPAAEPARHALIAAGRVASAAVYSAAGRRIGRIAEIAIDDATGDVAFVLVAGGGILGFGERLRRLPWAALSYSTDRGGYVVNADATADGGLDLTGRIPFQRSADRGGWAARA
jgi:hypothetical protein